MSYEEEDTYLVPHACHMRRRMHAGHMRRRIHTWFHTQLELTTTVSKETYYSVKRDLLQCQKRPTTVSKDTYLVPHAARVDTVVGLF